MSLPAPRLTAPALSSVLLLVGVACDGGSPPPAPEGELIFVRDGVVVPASLDVAGQDLPGARRLVAQAWAPGAAVSVGGLSDVAPARAECVPLFQVDLGDVSRLTAMGAPAPNTALAFSPDGGARLAVGSYRGEILVVDGWQGTVLARRTLAETMVKQVAWSADGQTLYAAEQSPDAYLYALDPATLRERWSLRLADLVGSSAPPGGEDIYGVYSLPAAYALLVLPDGELLVTALHSWTDAEAVKRNQAVVLRVRPDGTIRARWPADAPADATFQHTALDPAGRLAAITVNRSADGPPPADLPIAEGGVLVLDLETLAPTLQVQTPPLEPWFKTAYIWNGLDISSADNALYMGFGDGRVRVVDMAGADLLEKQMGVPVMAGEVPIHASVGWGYLHDGGVVLSTSKTLIPYGAASSSLRPPTAHPNENTLWSLALDGTVRWSWTGSQVIEGLSRSDDGQHLVVGAGSRQTDDRRDLYGALVFDLGGPPRGGEERLEAFCPTEGPVFFRQAMAADGRVAVSEHPYLEADGAVAGAYRLTVLR